MRAICFIMKIVRSLSMDYSFQTPPSGPTLHGWHGARTRGALVITIGQLPAPLLLLVTALVLLLLKRRRALRQATIPCPAKVTTSSSSPSVRHELRVIPSDDRSADRPSRGSPG
jgi:hypothetical protein